MNIWCQCIIDNLIDIIQQVNHLKKSVIYSDWRVIELSIFFGFNLWWFRVSKWYVRRGDLLSVSVKRQGNLPLFALRQAKGNGFAIVRRPNYYLLSVLFLCLYQRIYVEINFYLLWCLGLKEFRKIINFKSQDGCFVKIFCKDRLTRTKLLSDSSSEKKGWYTCGRKKKNIHIVKSNI